MVMCNPGELLPHPKTYVAPKALGAVEVDGVPDGEWERAPWTDDFIDIEGDRKPLPYHRTRVKMLWDDEFFYVFAELEEPHVWATLTEHDSVIFRDNDFEVFWDPSGDNHNYFEYEINAFATDWDLRLPKPYRNGGPAINAWEIPGLKKAVKVHGTINDPSDTDEKWTVELAFPWEAFREHAGVDLPPQDGTVWKVNFSRVQWQTDVVEGKYVKKEGVPEHNWVWSPQHAIDMHRPELWGMVLFAEDPNAEPPQDPLWTERAMLHRVLYAQQEHRRQQGRYAEELSQLGLPESWPVAFVVSGDGYRAVAGTGPYLQLDETGRMWPTR
jgi:hypothetical protein